MKIHASLLLITTLAFPPLTRAQGPTEARPLLIGDWADPTICKDGEDYYMTHSSGPFRPAMLIWHSRDSQTWTPLAHALPLQQGNVWVSEITKHEGLFHVYYSADLQVHVITAKSPAGPWSAPIQVEGAKSLDVGHAVDEAGKRFMLFGGGKVAELDPSGTRIIGEITRTAKYGKHDDESFIATPTGVSKKRMEKM